ncbi:hypothetical protein BGW80DRAFT_892478 [Lactifluus volemus]|nr:hypothetical protein BGW80DRAFT_892478 [Lactifluus volemus]
MWHSTHLLTIILAFLRHEMKVSENDVQSPTGVNHSRHLTEYVHVIVSQQTKHEVVKGTRAKYAISMNSMSSTSPALAKLCGSVWRKKFVSRRSSIDLRCCTPSPTPKFESSHLTYNRSIHRIKILNYNYKRHNIAHGTRCNQGSVKTRLSGYRELATN